jgi:phospholipid/cholesterol/gamma-HCH transport system ATP-binding protein
MIHFRQVWKAFRDKVVLRGVSLLVNEGETVFIVGSSGAGKSVLVKHLVGLLKPDQGEILLEGRDIAQLGELEFYEVRKKVGYVFQHSTLFDSLTVVQNVALPIRKHFRVPAAEARDRAIAKLELVQLADYAHRFPAELSAGMQKRVAIARTLTLEPPYVIYDEPTTGLDPVAARRVDRLMRDLADRIGVTSLVVSHDLTSIFTVADRIAMLYKGQFLLDGSPDDFKQAEHPVVRQYIAGDPVGPMET